MKNKKSLAETHPLVAEQWHHKLNGNLKPDDFTAKSHKKVWWKCDKGDDHVFFSQILVKTRHNGCPVCAGRIIVKSNCLATLNPELAKQWHPTKNGSLTPNDVGRSSRKKVWWKCDKGDDHVWESSINNRAHRGCPICSGKKVVKSNCLATLNPEIAKQWHPTKNGSITPYDVTNKSAKKFWWKCDKGDDHVWESSINNRTQNRRSCPVCSNQKVVESKSLAITHPELSKQWHPTKNRDLLPTQVTSGSNKIVWWKCDKGDDHIYQESIYDKSNGKECKVCKKIIIVKSNCLATLNPKLASEWHPSKNGKLTPNEVSTNYHKNIWWKCNKGDDHEWKASVHTRMKGHSCPFCTLTPQSRQELTITFELITLFGKINPKGYKTRLNGRLRSIDIFLPKLNLCIEFDGSYWHKDKRDIDKIKSEMLFDKGYKLIRVRQEPLKKIYETDVISKKPYNGKQVTNDVLSMILNLFDLDVKLVTKIKAYQSKSSLQNEKGLEKYIDEILTEKASKG